jgi:hypothetical protein
LQAAINRHGGQEHAGAKPLYPSQCPSRRFFVAPSFDENS